MYVLLVENADVVMWVQGRASNPTRRAIIRELLANNKAWPRHIRIVAFFMIGTFNNSDLQSRLEYEFEVFRDIVQNDYTGKARKSYINIYYTLLPLVPAYS